MKRVKASCETSCFRCIWPIRKGEFYYLIDGHPVCKKCAKEEDDKRMQVTDRH